MEEAAEGLERWVVLHQPIVYRAALLIVRDRSAAEDVAQETFLRAFRNAHRLPSDAEALRRLPDRLRVPLILRYYLDLSEKEIARAIGVRPGTVKSRLHVPPT